MSVLEWFRPPRQVLAVYLIGTLMAAAALAWLGWRLLDQERALSTSRAQERLEIAADRVTSSLQRGLDSLGRRLAGESGTLPDGTVV